MLYYGEKVVKILKKFLSGFILTVLLFAGLGIDDTSAHSGRTDKLGGHFITKSCSYIFHKPTSTVTGKNKAQIISLIKQNNSNTKCTKTLTEKKVNWNTVKYK